MKTEKEKLENKLLLLMEEQRDYQEKVLDLNKEIAGVEIKLLQLKYKELRAITKRADNNMYNVSCMGSTQLVHSQMRKDLYNLVKYFKIETNEDI